MTYISESCARKLITCLRVAAHVITVFNHEIFYTLWFHGTATSTVSMWKKTLCNFIIGSLSKMTSRNFLSPPRHEKTLHPGNLIIASGNAQLLMHKVHFTVNFETSSLNEIILQNFTHDIFSEALGRICINL